MADGIEFLMSSHRPGRGMGVALFTAAQKAGYRVHQPINDEYKGQFKILFAYGVGDGRIGVYRDHHIKAGGVAVVWDVGYFIRTLGTKEYMRCSINDDHPQNILDLAHDDGGRRWAAMGMPITNEGNPSGPIILAGMGYKSRKYAGKEGLGWEESKLRELQKRFPGRRIIYRPKVSRRFPYPPLQCETMDQGPIIDVLRGASLLVCRHSNVALDAVRMGVPFECTDGAAKWLEGKPYDLATRTEFLYKVSWWNWKVSEANKAFEFVMDAVRRLKEKRLAA